MRVRLPWGRGGAPVAGGGVREGQRGAAGPGGCEGAARKGGMAHTGRRGGWLCCSGFPLGPGLCNACFPEVLESLAPRTVDLGALLIGKHKL